MHEKKTCSKQNNNVYNKIKSEHSPYIAIGSCPSKVNDRERMEKKRNRKSIKIQNMANVIYVNE